MGKTIALRRTARRRHRNSDLRTSAASAGFPKAAAGLLVLAQALSVDAANPRNHIEAVRHQAAVVYLGRVRAVDERLATNFVSATARVDIDAVFRAPEDANPTVARPIYPSWNDERPPMAGGPQYRLEPGHWVLVFTGSFDGPIRAGEALIYFGEPGQLRATVGALRERLATMTAQDLAREAINEEGRGVQLQLYDAILEHLAGAVAEPSQ